VQKNVTRILLIECQSGQADDVRKVLSKCPAEITACDGIEQAWKLLFDQEQEESCADLVILEVGLSDLCGLGLIKKMRMDEPTKNIPVLILTNSSETQKAVDLFELPLTFSVVKPFTFGKLIYALPALNMKVSDSMLSIDTKAKNFAPTTRQVTHRI